MNTQDHAERLQACLASIEDGVSVADAVATFPEAADDLLPLLLTAQLVRRERPRPEAQWRQSVEGRWAEGSGQGVIVRPRRWATRLAAVAAAVVFALGGLVVASADSMPGDALYPVRRGVQRAADVASGIVRVSIPRPESVEPRAGEASSQVGVPVYETRAGEEASGGADTTRRVARPNAPPMTSMQEGGEENTGDVGSASSVGAAQDASAASGSERSVARDTGGVTTVTSPVTERAASPAPRDAPAEQPRVETDMAPPMPATGADPLRPPAPAPPTNEEPPTPRGAGAGVMPPPDAPPALPAPTATPAVLGVVPVPGPGAGVVQALGRVQGRVIGDEREPLGDMKVAAYLASARFARGRSRPRPILTVETDAEGRFEMSSLLPGNYIIAAREDRWFSKETYFPDTADRWRATVVTVRAEQATTGIDIKIRRGRWESPWREIPGMP